MNIPFMLLSFQTLFLWFAVIIFHRLKNRITLIPLYCIIAVFILITHYLSDLGLVINVGEWHFYISSVSFFTSLMLAFLILYLFEGARAARFGFYIMMFSSIFYILIVNFISREVEPGKFLNITFTNYIYYFWSNLAIIIDVFFIAIIWEVLSRFSKIPTWGKVFIVIFGTFSIDAIIFVTGVFSQEIFYLPVLRSNVIIRFVLALIVTPIISFYLSAQNYKEENRTKNKRIWEILNFKPDLESRIQFLETNVKREEELKKELQKVKEIYALALEGANAGLWQWDVVKDEAVYSPKFCYLLGYQPGEIYGSLNDFKKYIHEDDLQITFQAIDESLKNHKNFDVEFRLKNKNGEYKWYQIGGITKFDQEGKPTLMVGSIIDIDEKKHLLKKFEQKVSELENFNKILVERELQMTKLKEKIEELEKKISITNS